LIGVCLPTLAPRLVFLRRVQVIEKFSFIESDVFMKKCVGPRAQRRRSHHTHHTQHPQDAFWGGRSSPGESATQFGPGPGVSASRWADVESQPQHQPPYAPTALWCQEETPSGHGKMGCSFKCSVEWSGACQMGQDSQSILFISCFEVRSWIKAMGVRK